MRLACRQLVATLKPHFAEAGENATWQEVIMKVHPDVGFNASKVSASPIFPGLLSLLGHIVPSYQSVHSLSCTSDTAG